METVNFTVRGPQVAPLWSCENVIFPVIFDALVNVPVNVTAIFPASSAVEVALTFVVTVPVDGTAIFGSRHGISANGSTPTGNVPEPKQPSVWKTKFVSVFPPGWAVNWIVGLKPLTACSVV